MFSFDIAYDTDKIVFGSDMSDEPPRYRDRYKWLTKVAGYDTLPTTTQNLIVGYIGDVMTLSDGELADWYAECGESVSRWNRPDISTGVSAEIGLAFQTVVGTVIETEQIRRANGTV